VLRARVNVFDLREIRLTGRTDLSRHGGVLDLQVPLLKKARMMRLIDRDVHDAYRDFVRAVQLTQSYPLSKHLSSLISNHRTRRLKTPLPAFSSVISFVVHMRLLNVLLPY